MDHHLNACEQAQQSNSGKNQTYANQFQPTVRVLPLLLSERIETQS